MLQYCFLFLLSCVFLAPTEATAATVINAGVGGNRSSQLLKRLDRDVLAKQPTTVVLMVGTNDRLNSGGFIDIQSYRKNVESLIDQIEAGGAKVLLVTPPTCVPELLFNRHDRKKYDDQSPVARMQEVRTVLLEVAQQKKVDLLDFHDYLIQQPGEQWREGWRASDSRGIRTAGETGGRQIESGQVRHDDGRLFRRQPDKRFRESELPGVSAGDSEYREVTVGLMA